MGILKLSIFTVLVIGSLLKSVASVCSSLNPRESLYTNLNLVNRMYNHNRYPETLLPRPLMRRRNKAESDQRASQVRSMLSLLEQGQVVARMTGALGNTLHLLTESIHQNICTYVKQEFKIDCNQPREVERVLKTLDLRQTIQDSVPAVTPDRHMRTNPSCSCIQELFPDQKLRRVAIITLNLIGCQ